MERFEGWMGDLNNIVWGPPMIVLLVGTGLYLTIRLGGIQLRGFIHSIKCISGKFDKPEEEGDISHFQALSAALSATIGTGNIAGVGIAIAAGGPGAVFWMWITALVGMATKFTSCSLALRYRTLHPDGSASGGPMYFLRDGLKLGWLGMIFAIFAGIASLGIGCAVQANSVFDGFTRMFGEARRIELTETWVLSKYIPGLEDAALGATPIAGLILGSILAVLVGIVILGGIKRIAQVASRVVPFMCIVYVLGATWILIANASGIPDALKMIVHYAFSPLAIGGGVLGSVIQMTVRQGVARGIFSNESGLGSAPMAHAAAKTKEMAREGYVAMLGPFIDTIIVCTMTALVIIVMGTWQVHGNGGEILYGPGGQGLPMMYEGDRVVGTVGPEPTPILNPDTGEAYVIPTSASLTSSAFEAGLPNLGKFIVAFGLVFFAFSTMIAWSYYGDRCFGYIFGERAIKPYRWVFCVVIVLGTIGGLDLVWLIADNLNAMMAIPNLVALLLLAGVVKRETKDYDQRMRDGGEW